jgi:hypothetical protein
MTVYHGQHAVDSRHIEDLQGWRVDWRRTDRGSGHTARTIIRCPWDNHERDGVNTADFTRMIVGLGSNIHQATLQAYMAFETSWKTCITKAILQLLVSYLC